MIDIKALERDWLDHRFLTQDLCKKYRMYHAKLMRLAIAQNWPPRKRSLYSGVLEKDKPVRLIRAGKITEIPKLPNLASELRGMKKYARTHL